MRVFTRRIKEQDKEEDIEVVASGLVKHIADHPGTISAALEKEIIDRVAEKFVAEYYSTIVGLANVEEIAKHIGDRVVIDIAKAITKAVTASILHPPIQYHSGLQDSMLSQFCQK